MSLESDLEQWYESASYPPEGPELDQELVDGNWQDKDTETELVSSEDLGDARWGTHFRNIYKRGDELVAVQDVRPATEMQDWGDYGEPEIYPVTARTETVVITKYERLT